MRERYAGDDKRRVLALAGLGLLLALLALVFSGGCAWINRPNDRPERPCPDPCPRPLPCPTPVPTPVPTPTPAPTPTPPVPTPTPSPTPPTSFCVFPQGVPDEDFVEHPTVPTQHEVDLVNGALQKLGHCEVNSDCPLGTTNPQVAMQRVIDELHQAGVCAGQHRAGETDEIAMTSYGCVSAWQGFHAVKYPTNPGDQVKAVWARVPYAPCMGDACKDVNGGSYRGAWLIPPGYCGGRAGRRVR